VIPARLSLRNFLCYREPPPLDFDGVSVACLTGENGNGKSAILDAMTWALWGEARARTQVELVALGQTDMEVEFEFYAGEARYRVIRKLRRVRGGAATTPILTFHVWDGSAWRDNSGSVVRETEARIRDVLKLTYETFINSAFLMQGRADAFTVRSPGERKQVLADILDLGRYDTYESRAKERRNDRRQQVEHLERQIHDNEYQLRNLVALRRERDAINERLHDLKVEIDGVAALQTELTEQVAEVRRLESERAEAGRARDQAVQQLATATAHIGQQSAAIARYEAITADAAAVRAGFARLAAARELLLKLTVEADGLRRQIHDAERDQKQATIELAQATRRVEQRRSAITGLRGLVADADAIHLGHEQLMRARAVQAGHDERLTRLLVLQQELEPLEKAIEAAAAQLRSALAVQESEATRLGLLAGKVAELRAAQAAVLREREDIESTARTVQALRDEEQEYRAEVERLGSLNTVLRAAIDEIKRKMDEVKQAAEKGAVDCPLCRSPMGHDALVRVSATYESEGKARSQEFRTNRTTIQDREAAAQAAGQKARTLESDLQSRRRDVESRLAGVSHRLADAEEAAERVVTVTAEVARVEAVLQTGAFATNERARTETLRREIGALAYDQRAHAEARRAAAGFEPFEAKYRALVQAQSQLDAAESALVSEEEAWTGWQRREQQGAARLADLRGQLADLALDAAQRDVMAHEGFDARHRELLESESMLPAARAALDGYQSAAEGWQRERDSVVLRTEELEHLLSESAGVADRLREVTERLSGLRGRRVELERAIGGTEQEVERLERLEEETAGRRTRLVEAQREQAVYEQLVRAFGKQGVQALIIESALPEIEAVANDLLGRMTNNRMHVTLETQRENQKGEVRETLEIKIADEWGTRNYEMFSGGEAFRINLALRIALSKLLARRAGAPLPTLVIDEGFGTQDAAARERLIEAINVIQQDFRMLLLVTHIDELKDLFETRIEVTKTSEGSVARVVAA
jgi:DNA repair protein SbcC/Rad50